MRIDGTGRIIPNTVRQGSSSARTGGIFRPEGGEEVHQTHRQSAPATTTGIDALLAIQAADDATTGRRKAVKRANLLLDALEEIRADLLAGRVSEGRLNRAVALLKQAKTYSEPGLDELVADIELRVRVELAKLGQYPSM